MTLSSAYIELFIRGEKSGGEMSGGGNVRIPSLPTPSSLQITKHLHPAPLSVTPGFPLQTEVPTLQKLLP